MTTQHTKSSCCQALARCYGERRRQCAKCLRTWRKSPHKRGRKRKRVNYNLLSRVLDKQQTINNQLVHYPNCSDDTIYKRFQQALEQYVSKPRTFPKLRGKYILLADAQWYSFDGENWTLYLFLLKPRRRNMAYILDPVILQGGETFKNWSTAIETIPEQVRERIIAFVSDEFRTSVRIADHYGWLHQLCQFHLLSALYRRLGKRKNVIFGKHIREAVYKTVRCLLDEKDPGKIQELKENLKALADDPECPEIITMIATQFLRRFERYRTSLSNPDHTIPRTTSAVESFGKTIRKRTRPLNKQEAVRQWAVAIARHKQKMTCNGQKQRKYQPN